MTVDTGRLGERRLRSHPILEVPERAVVEFTFEGRPLTALEGEVVSSALYAHGIEVFGHHFRDGGPQGIFCVNGQCSQCTIMVNGRAVKACMTRVTPGMRVEPCDGLPPLPAEDGAPRFGETREVDVEVLIVGGGPAGLCAAFELGRLGIRTLVIDDKTELGGKLSLQTHPFFGSIQDCYAGTRGIDIAAILADRLAGMPAVSVWLDSLAVGIFHDKKIGVVKGGGYVLVKPRTVLIACGAREKALYFPGADLPGVYGAGAFQTLLNRDRIRPTDRLFIVGGGNVGLIGGYHALQAGIKVVGLVEALPKVGGYKVHLDKLKRLGVPVYLSHTVVRAEGKETLERITIAAIDRSFKPIAGTERSWDVDTLLVAVGLSPVNELAEKAREYGIPVHLAGDAEEIAEASAAMFSGRIAGRKIARSLSVEAEVPPEWTSTAHVLRSKPGAISLLAVVDRPDLTVRPVIRCVEEIPCNPCTQVCPLGSITIPDGTIMGLPVFEGGCFGCGRCVLVCPGLAVSLVVDDYDPERRMALLMLPFEFEETMLDLPEKVATVDMDGAPVGEGTVVAVRRREDQDRRRLVLVEVPYEDRLRVAGFTIQEVEKPLEARLVESDDDPMVCRCERVRKSEIVKHIRAGVRDINQLKAVSRANMGGCGGKTCTDLVLRLFREEGVEPKDVSPGTRRPFVAEVPLGVYAALEDEDK